MLATHLGFYNTSSTRTHVRFMFSTHAAAGGNVAPSSAFEVGDLLIYKATNGAAFSATQRTSTNGIAITSPFDSSTGLHDVVIDLTDNSDSGFYAAGCLYAVVLVPDETIDGQTLTGVVLAYFEIGRDQVDVREFGGASGTFASGRPEVNTSHVSGTAQTAGDIPARLPAALVSGRMDSSVGAMANNVITDAAMHSELDIYTGKLWLIDDDGGSADRYAIIWFKNGAPVPAASVTSPEIRVYDIASGSDLIAATAMTEVGTEEDFRYVASTTERTVAGVHYIARCTATIDGASRVWKQNVGRDSA